MRYVSTVKKFVSTTTAYYKFFWLISGFLLFPGHALANVEKLQEVPLPGNVTAQTVAIDVIQHGHRMSMATLINAYPVEDVMDFYRQQWAAPVAPGLPGFVE